MAKITSSPYHAENVQFVNKDILYASYIPRYEVSEFNMFQFSNQH